MPASRPLFRADLEALRGLAVLLVVAYHAGVPFLQGGFVGVDVFFVLSGYFAALALSREFAATGSVDLPTFYSRRALRLVPALLIVVAATLAAVWVVYAPIDRADVASTARSVVLGTANNDFARRSVDYFGGADSPFLHTWSLAVEQQISLFGPLLFLALVTLGGWGASARDAATSAADESARRSAGLLRGAIIGLAVAAALSLAAAIRLTGTDQAWAFFGAPTRAWEFISGGLLALVLPAGDGAEITPEEERGSGWWLQLVGLLAVAGAALLYDRATPYPGAAALLPVLGAAAFVAGGARGRGAVAADGPGVPALRWFGGLSYSWYLWHWPFIVIGAVLLPTIGVWGRLALAAGALAPAWLTHRFVEQPARRAGRGEGAPASLWSMATVAACVVSALAAGRLDLAAQRRAAAPDQRALAAARIDRMSHSCWAGPGVVAPSGACVFGDPHGAVTVALMGDSHAEHWLAALDALGRERGWRVLVMVKGGCPVADAPELIGPPSRRHARECARYRDASVRRLVALRPAVAILSSWDEYVVRDADTPAGRATGGRVPPEAWRRGLRRTYGRLAAAGVPVVAMRGTPFPGFDVPACLSRRADGRPLARPCEYERDASLHSAARAAQLAAIQDVARRGLPVRAVDMADEVCASSPCGVVRGGRVVFTDDNHLTAGFTRSAAGVLGARLDQAARSLGVRLP